MPRSSPPPNVLLVIADDHRADAIGAFGHPVVRTPELDALVQRGTAFTQARIMGGLMPAVCAPSRACLLTGRDVFRADASPGLQRGPNFEVRLPADACTLPERFRAAGYETFFTGKWHNDLPSLERSFEVAENIFVGGMCDHTAVPVTDLEGIKARSSPHLVSGFSTAIFCGSAEGFLRERKRERPFFACVALTSPHDPRTPPPEFRALYDPAKIPLPTNFLGEHPFDNGELDVRDERLAPKPLLPEVVRAELAAYYGMISHHDGWLGRIFETLRDTGQADNTLVVYISDHGLALGSHGLLGKQNLYEASVRVPFLMAGPGVPRGARIDTPAYSLDLYATVCELAGVSPPTGLESRSLVPAFAAGRIRVRETTCAAYMDFQRMATDGRWKLVVFQVAGTERVQLFDLRNDPEERSDVSLSAENASQITQLRAVLARWRQRVGDRWWMEIPAGVIVR